MKLKTMSAALLLTLPFWACAKDITIIYTNDLHAHVEPYKVPWIADGKRDIGGWANITTMVKQEKAKNNATWFFDAGDYFTGPYISSLTKAKAIIDIMNTMSYDALSVIMSSITAGIIRCFSLAGRHSRLFRAIFLSEQR